MALKKSACPAENLILFWPDFLFHSFRQDQANLNSVASGKKKKYESESATCEHHGCVIHPKNPTSNMQGINFDQLLCIYCAKKKSCFLRTPFFVLFRRLNMTPP